MRGQTSGTVVEAVRGDITVEDVDVIVNAANESLAGGGGVDGAIHRAAGPELVIECLTLGGCRAGEAKASSGYRLKAGHVVHTVGPRWRGGHEGEARTLASCYRESLRRAAELGAASVAFPSISTGVFGYPVELAAPVAVGAVKATLQELEHPPELVRFVLFDERTLAAYRRALAQPA